MEAVAAVAAAFEDGGRGWKSKGMVYSREAFEGHDERSGQRATSHVSLALLVEVLPVVMMVVVVLFVVVVVVVVMLVGSTGQQWTWQ